MGQVIEAELKLKYGKAINEVAELKKELNEVKESFEANEKAAKDSEKGAKGFGNTLKAIGQAGGIIFLLKKAFEGLKAAINSNQQVADTFKVILGTISQVFGEVANVLVDVYNSKARWPPIECPISERGWSAQPTASINASAACRCPSKPSACTINGCCPKWPDRPCPGQ